MRWLAEQPLTLHRVRYRRVFTCRLIQEQWHAYEGPSSGPENPIQLRDRFCIIRNMLKHMNTNDYVETGVREREVDDIPYRIHVWTRILEIYSHKIDVALLL